MRKPETVWDRQVLSISIGNEAMIGQAHGLEVDAHRASVETRSLSDDGEQLGIPMGARDCAVGKHRLDIAATWRGRSAVRGLSVRLLRC